MPLTISFLLAALAIAEPLILCSRVVYAALPTLLKLRTIGELIVTLFAASGTAITNPVVVPAIYQAGNYSIEYLVEEDILNVEGHPEYTDEEVITSLGTGKAFNLDTTGFRNLMETNWQSMRDYQIDAVMRLNEIANTDSVYGAIDNIGGILQDVCKYGYCGFENTIAMVSNPLVTVKVSLENINDAIKNIFGKNIKNNAEINVGIPNDVSNEFRILARKDGLYYYILEKTNNENYIFCINDGRNRTIRCFSENKKYENMNRYRIGSDGIIQQTSIVNVTALGVDNTYPIVPEYYVVSSEEGTFVDNLYSKYLNGNLKNESISPDIIGENGNINEYSGVGINEGSGIDIIDREQYEEFIDSANENTENEEYTENALIYEELINNNEVIVPEEEPEPIIPVQPTDFPVRPTLTPEQTVQSMKGATPGITEFFPFCIPGDIVALFGSLNVEARQAPIITWNWEIERFGIEEEIIIDFSPYDTVASILRNLELILFIIGLAVATRNLIGA